MHVQETADVDIEAMRVAEPFSLIAVSHSCSSRPLRLMRPLHNGRIEMQPRHYVWIR